MKRACDVCGREYEAKRSTSRFCGSSCRARNTKNPATPVAVVKGEPDPLVTATAAELDAAGQLETVRGRQALALAAQMTSGSDTGSSVAALSKEFRAVMDEIRSLVPAKADPMDQLRQRRERKAGVA